MTQSFDVVIVSGIAGKSIASGLAAADRTVAIIEKDLWGGTCPNLMAFKKTFTEPVPEQSKKSLESAGVTTITGSADQLLQPSDQSEDQSGKSVRHGLCLSIYCERPSISIQLTPHVLLLVSEHPNGDC